MLEYRFSFNAVQGIFPIPCPAVDTCINEASHSDLKVLLYIYRHGGSPLGEETLCEDLCLKPMQVRQSISFWASKNLLSFTCGEAAQEAARPAPQRAPKRVVEMPAQYTQEDITGKIRENSEIRFLLETAPGLLGRLLSPADCSTLIYLYEGAGLPADVILMLLEYCVSSGHANMRYFEKAALSWSEEGINTHEMAENKIRDLEARRSFEGAVRSMMGITGRALTQSERQHIARWAEWKVPTELLQLSYEICVNRTGKISFSYINSILAAWREKGIRTLEEAKNENRKKPGKATSYDIDEYVDLSMKRLLNE